MDLLDGVTHRTGRMQQYRRMLDPTPSMFDKRVHVSCRRPHFLKQQWDLDVQTGQQALRFHDQFPKLYQ